MELGPEALEFLLDTGADRTMIHPAGAEFLGVDFDVDFKGVEMQTVPGVGTASAWLEDAVIQFPRTDGKFDTVRGRVLIARPSRTNQQHPNLVGRDIFDNYSITYDRAGNKLELRP